MHSTGANAIGIEKQSVTLPHVSSLGGFRIRNLDDNRKEVESFDVLFHVEH